MLKICFNFILIFFMVIGAITPAAAEKLNNLLIGPNTEQKNYYEHNIPIDLPKKYRVFGYTDTLGNDGAFHPVFITTAALSSSNPSIATIDAYGTITGHDFGTTVITAVYDGKTASYSLSVDKPSQISFDNRTYLYGPNTTIPIRLSASYTYDSLDILNKAQIVSSDPEIVEVKGSTVTTKKAGTATLTATYADQKDAVSISVSQGVGSTSTGNSQTILSPQKISAIDYINKYRSYVGLNQVTVHSSLDQAAQAHSNYIAIHGTSDFHGEFSSNSGFTGTYPWDRARNFGYTGSGITEGVSPRDNTNNLAIKSLMDAPYHRAGLLLQGVGDVGIGIVDGKATVVNLGGNNLSTSNEVVYFPYSGQTDVDPSWRALESPNPMAPHGKEGAMVGYPITVHVPIGGSIQYTSATIKDSQNQLVDFYRTDATNTSSKDLIILTPKERLKPSTTYTVAFQGQYLNQTKSSTPISQIWSFTTRSLSLTNIQALSYPASLNVNSSGTFSVTATYEDGSTMDVTNSAQYAVADSSILSVVAGKLTGMSPGNTAITISYGGKTNEFGVTIVKLADNNLGISNNGLTPQKQLENTKLPQPNATKPVLFHDVNNHWAAATIDWAINEKLIEGYEDGTFKPDQSVTEAEFVTLLFKLYPIDVNSYTSLNEYHWSDKYYKVAKEYHFPLLGLNELAIRDQALKRTQVAEIVAGIDGFSYQGDEAIQYLLEKKYASGKTSASVQGFEGNGLLTRAEALQFLKNLRDTGLKEMKIRP